MSALKIRKGAFRHSAHNLCAQFSDVPEIHTRAVIADNQPPGLCAAAPG